MKHRPGPARRRPAVIAVLAVGLAGAAIALIPRHDPAPRPPLLLITSLPLLFGEEFGLDKLGSPVLSRLEQHYAVRPIAAADRASLKGQRLLLMAHPRAQPAELLVELDRWVRGGGRLLLLADPKLDWPSRLPLGDRLRPPSEFSDTGLLRHWGLALDGPEPDGPASLDVGGDVIATISPGRLRIEGKGGCALDAGGFIARCTIGQGKAVIIADADFLDVEDAGARSTRNLDLLDRELKTLSAPD